VHAVVLRNGQLTVGETPDPVPGPEELLLKTLSTGLMEQSHAMAGHVDGLIMAADNDSGVNAVGFYDDGLVQSADGWRIAWRQFTLVRVSPVGP
jgi:hypothetical protein